MVHPGQYTLPGQTKIRQLHAVVSLVSQCRLVEGLHLAGEPTMTKGDLLPGLLSIPCLILHSCGKWITSHRRVSHTSGIFYQAINIYNALSAAAVVVIVPDHRGFHGCPRHRPLLDLELQDLGRPLGPGWRRTTLTPRSPGPSSLMGMRRLWL